MADGMPGPRSKESRSGGGACTCNNWLEGARPCAAEAEALDPADRSPEVVQGNTGSAERPTEIELRLIHDPGLLVVRFAIRGVPLTSLGRWIARTHP